MSHQHFCGVGNHWWACDGLFPWPWNDAPVICPCLDCGTALESSDHIHRYVEVLPCPEHMKNDALREIQGYGSCPWCGREFCYSEEAEGHYRNNLRACLTYKLLAAGMGGGYPRTISTIEELLEAAGPPDEGSQGDIENPETSE